MQLTALSKNALRDLRKALKVSYGQDFDTDLFDDQLNKLGVLFLTILAESVKLDIARPELTASKS